MNAIDRRFSVVYDGDSRLFGPRVARKLGWPELIAAGLAVAVAVVAMVYSPGPPRIQLTGTGLTIQDRLHSTTVAPAAVDLASVRVVDTEAEPGWRPRLKVKGFSNLFYRSGQFVVGNGKTVELFGRRTNRMVLLPPKSDSALGVLVESPEPEALVAELRSEWGSRP